MYLKLDGEEYLVLSKIESIKYDPAYKQIQMRTDGGRVYTVPVPRTKGVDWRACMQLLMKKVAETHKVEPKVQGPIFPR
jgi:hypothetical protein